MNKSPFFAIVWVAIGTFGLIGIPRFLSVFHDLLSVENDSMGFKRLIAAGVFVAHLPYLLALIFTVSVRPRRTAFNKVGILGSIASCALVSFCFAAYGSYVDRTYPVNIQFVDQAGERVSDLSVIVEREVEGFTLTTSPLKRISIVLHDGFLSIQKSVREVLTIRTNKHGFAYTRVEVHPMGGRYPVGPLQKIDMSWFIDPKGGKSDTYTSGSKNWSFSHGTLIVPIPVPSIPLNCPIPKYTEDDWKLLSKTE